MLPLRCAGAAVAPLFALSHPCQQIVFWLEQDALLIDSPVRAWPGARGAGVRARADIHSGSAAPTCQKGQRRTCSRPPAARASRWGAPGGARRRAPDQPHLASAGGACATGRAMRLPIARQTPAR
ncbi:hypothetical protein T492DRAFT_948580, partial [Pavlovales sp. CCMP2436]